MRVLWIGKRPTDGKAGDEVFDRKTIAACQSLGHTVDVFHPNHVGRGREVWNILMGIPHNRARFAASQTIIELQQISRGYDVVICSWEPFDRLALRLPRPAIVILHNMTSRSAPLLFPGSLLAKLAAQRARVWERRHYRRGTFGAIALLSQRDRAYVAALSDPPEVLFVPPGMPPAIELSPDATLCRELVISGTFDWRPKHRDVIRFAQEYATVACKLPVRADALPAAAAAVLNILPPLITADCQTALRFGLITDRFESGHKLKTLSYIANNQIVITFADVSFDFEHIPDHDFFIRRIHSVAEMVAVIDSFAAFPSQALRDRFVVFQRQCAASFTWQAVAASLMGAATDLTEPSIRVIHEHERRAVPSPSA